MAHIVFNALSLRPGGGLQVARALLEAMSRQGSHHFTVWCADPRSKSFLSQVFDDNPRVTLEDPIGKSGNVRLFVWQMTRLAAALRQARADLMLGINHHFPAGEVPQVVYHLNVLRFERPVRKLWQKGEIADRLRDWRAAYALHLAAANVTESQYLLDLAMAKVPQINNPSIVYIGHRNGVQEQQSEHVIDGSQRILVLTSAQPHKDNSTLIRMLAKLVVNRSDIDWRLEIAGGQGASSFQDLQAEASALGVSERIEYLGFQNHEALALRAKTALCLVSTSRVESFSMVSLEAMSWSCPPVVTDTTSMPESVGDAGLYASAGNSEEFADHVLRLYTDPGLRQDLVANGARRLKGMTWASAGAAFIDLIEQILSPQTAKDS